ncbi:MAG: hypothetical protein LBI96_05705 [Odoribacteraceae bacterium]|jgi:hypothetical protein|nr:hypothetical protein [Odoribacteraceae bacterium]
MRKFENVRLPLTDPVTGRVKVYTFSPARLKGLFRRVKKLAKPEREMACALILTLGGLSHDDVPDWARAAAKRWHGSIAGKVINIDNLTDTLVAHRSLWPVPQAIIDKMTKGQEQLAALVKKCNSSEGSPSDREARDTLIKDLVTFALQTVRNWVFGQYADGVLTRQDVHSLGFLLLGETAGRRDRSEDTRVIASVKVGIIDADSIYVVVDQASLENSALVVHGWPEGVREVLLVITAADGVTEVLRKTTRSLHNEILMPPGSHGKQFMIKASFMKHPDDVPHFGNEPTFSMPLTTEDLAASAGK